MTPRIVSMISSATEIVHDVTDNELETATKSMLTLMRQRLTPLRGPQ